MAIANTFKQLLSHEASVVTISISTTRMASENYGFMAPVKAALDSSLAFLAKSFSNFSEVRFNAVAPGLLKTSGIGRYSRLCRFLPVCRASHPAGEGGANERGGCCRSFSLSRPKSSGINAQRLVVDAGMEVNYFDHRLIEGYLDGDKLLPDVEP